MIINFKIFESTNDNINIHGVNIKDLVIGDCIVDCDEDIGVIVEDYYRNINGNVIIPVKFDHYYVNANADGVIDVFFENIIKIKENNKYNISWKNLKVDNYIIDAENDIGIIIKLNNGELIVNFNIYGDNDVNDRVIVRFRDVKYHGTKDEIEMIIHTNKYNL